MVEVDTEASNQLAKVDTLAKRGIYTVNNCFNCMIAGGVILVRKDTNAYNLVCLAKIWNQLWKHHIMPINRSLMWMLKLFEWRKNRYMVREGLKNCKLWIFSQVPRTHPPPYCHFGHLWFFSSSNVYHTFWNFSGTHSPWSQCFCQGVQILKTPCWDGLLCIPHVRSSSPRYAWFGEPVMKYTSMTIPTGCFIT